jgi:hypothetical protein
MVAFAELLNVAARQLTSDGSVPISLPPRLLDRLDDRPLFRFGFDDFVPEKYHDRLVARIRVCLKYDEPEPCNFRFWEESVVVTKTEIAKHRYNIRPFLVDKLTTAYANLCGYIADQHSLSWEEYEQLVKERH